jgi:hypothetical protein
VSRAIPCFLSTPTSLVRYPNKGSAVAHAKAFGGSVHRECECGCGNPASKAIFAARAPANERTGGAS